MTEFYKVFSGDAIVKARWASAGLAGKGLGVNRQAFWITFVVTTGGYIYFRYLFSESERIEFVAQTEFFFEKVNECRAANPYDK